MASPLMGQNNTSSPYSTRGFGEIEQFNSAFTRSLGGVQNGIRTQRSIAFSNPASIGALKHVVFDFGFRSQYSQLSLDQKIRTQYSGNFNYFNLAFPVYKKQLLKDSSTNKNQNKLYKEYKTIWASGFGVSPYSSINSSYYTIQKFNNDSIIDQGNYYSKTGGLSQLYWMNGVNLSNFFIDTFHRIQRRTWQALADPRLSKISSTWSSPGAPHRGGGLPSS